MFSNTGNLNFFLLISMEKKYSCTTFNLNVRCNTKKLYKVTQICTEHEVQNGVFGLHFFVYLYFHTERPEEGQNEIKDVNNNDYDTNTFQCVTHTSKNLVYFVEKLISKHNVYRNS